MTKDFTFKEQYGFEDLVSIMAILRGQGGCPWDREQTHESIRQNFIEETYEVIEAIDEKDPVLLQEELGDVLLQVVFHSQMEQETGRFDVNNVIDGICKKLIVRHPHIFADTVAADTAQVLKNWDEIKKRTKKQSTQTEVIQSVPRTLPALMRSSKVQQKAAKVGFDWPDVNGAIEKTREELEELEEAIAKGEKSHSAEELGDLLFSVVNISRFIDAEPEESLTFACDKFVKRFSIVEKLANDSARDLKAMTLAQLDELWDQAKEELSGK